MGERMKLLIATSCQKWKKWESDTQEALGLLLNLSSVVHKQDLHDPCISLWKPSMGKMQA